MGYLLTLISTTLLVNILSYFLCGQAGWQTIEFGDPGNLGGIDILLELLEAFVNLILIVIRFLFLPAVTCFGDLNTIMVATISILIPLGWGILIASLFRGGGMPN